MSLGGTVTGAARFSRDSQFLCGDKAMGELTDKIKGSANEAIGKVKRESNDPDTRAEGEAQELKGDFQKAKGEVKGAFNKL